MSSMNSLRILFLLVATSTAFAWVPPICGIGSILFPVRGVSLQPLREEESPRETVYEATDFFVDAFWTGKVGGGAQELTQQQQRNLAQSQAAEFNKRYGGSAKRKSDLIICRNNKGTIIACAGVQMENIPNDSLNSRDYRAKAPLMSNLAVSRKYRRRGLAERLVKAVEAYVAEEWEADECYLYVETRNGGAVRLYRKLGYRPIWNDADATTLLPTEDGRLLTASTEITAMRKSLKSSSWWSLFG